MLKKKVSLLIDWLYKNAFYIILALGTAFRLYYYIINPSFFLDEARTGAFLYKDIAWYFGITWPMGQLWLQQVISSIFGYSEYVLRLTPFLGAILSMVVVYKLMLKWFGKNFAIIFLALFAFAPLAVQFSVEYKQYSVDLLITALYMLTFTNILNEKVLSNKNFVFLLLLSIFGPWLSYPLIFSILTWTGLYLVFKKFKINKDNVKIAIAGVLGVVSFAVLYFLFVKKSTEAAGLITYWNVYYMPLDPIKLLHWIKLITLDISENLLGFRHYFILIGVALVGLGLVSIILDKKYKEALFFLSPLLVVLVASIFKKYPFGERVLFFLLPSFYMLITYGIFAFKKLEDLKFLKKLSYLTKYAVHLIFAMTLVVVVYVSVVYMHTIVIREPLRPVMEQMKEKYTVAIPIHVTATAKDAWMYYNHRFNIAPEKVTYSSWNAKGMLKDIGEISLPTWLVFSHITEPVLDSYLDAIHERGDVLEDIYIPSYPTTRAILFLPTGK